MQYAVMAKYVRTQKLELTKGDSSAFDAKAMLHHKSELSPAASDCGAFNSSRNFW